MLAVTVEFRIVPRHVEKFRAAVIAQARNSLHGEKQCRRFDVCFDPAEPTRVFLYEIYDDRAAFDAHMQTPHFADFNAKVTDWVEFKNVRTWDVAPG